MTRRPERPPSAPNTHEALVASYGGGWKGRLWALAVETMMVSFGVTGVALTLVVYRKIHWVTGELLSLASVLVGAGITRLVMRLLADPLITVRGLTRLAVLIGGRKRAWRGEEWAADQAIGAAPGSPPSTRARLRHAVGLVFAAIRLRAGDLLDWTLAQPRTEVIVAATTMCSIGYHLQTAGFHGLMSNTDNVVAVAVLTYGPARWLRHLRGVPPVSRRGHGGRGEGR